MDRQLIRLIVTTDPSDPDARLSEALGITAERMEEIESEVLHMAGDPNLPMVSMIIKKITETYFKDAELALALYLIGTIIQRGHCNTCRLGGTVIKLF